MIICGQQLLIYLLAAHYSESQFNVWSTFRRKTLRTWKN